MATRIPALIQLSDPRVAAQLVSSKWVKRVGDHTGFLDDNSNNNNDKAEIKKIPYLCYDYTNKIPGETVRLDNNEYII